MHRFSATLHIIGINPFVFVPEKVLAAVFKAAGKDKGAIPVRGSVNGQPYTQTLVRYGGDWRLYINMMMLKNSPNRIGEKIRVEIEWDGTDRTVPDHEELLAALKTNKAASAAFVALSPSRRKEINRYLHRLKSEGALRANIEKVIRHLEGKGSFAGRH